VTSTARAADAPGVAVAADVAGTFSEAMNGGTGGVKEVAGNPLAADKAWTFSTASASSGTSETVTLTATADSYVSSGSGTANYGTSTHL
jgi:hypothetical protein